MSVRRSDGLGDLLVTDVRRLDEAGDRFEAGWLHGCRPRLEDELAGLIGPLRTAYLRELLALELELRRDLGESVTLEECLRRFPGDEAEIRQLFETKPGPTRPRSSPPDAPAHGRPRAGWDHGDDAAAWVGSASGGSESVGAPRRFGAALEIPGYRILGEIGRGGMGVVYRAEQLRLGRQVALKVLAPAAATHPDRLARFRTEAEVAAKLSDENVLPVYDVLETPAGPALVIPLVEGCDLARLLADRRAFLGGGSTTRPHPGSTLARLGYLAFILPLLDRVVAAVAAIHRCGVLHRDIKPSNVLVDRQGGRG